LGGYGGEVEEPGGEVVNLGSGGGYNLGWGGCRFLGGFWVGFWVGFTCVLGVLANRAADCACGDVAIAALAS